MTLDPRTKIICLTVFGWLAVMLDGTLALLTCLLVSLALMYSSPQSKARLRLLALVLLISTWATVYSQAIFYDQTPRTPLLTIIPETFPFLGSLTSGVSIYKEGLWHGLRQSLRFSMLITMGAFVVTTTQPRDLLLGLIRLGVPYPISFMTTTAIRYLPMLGSEAQLVLKSQQLRGVRHFQLNPLSTLRHLVGTVRPILINNIRRATRMSEAIESRAFSADQLSQRTYLHQLQLKVIDRILILLLLTGCTLVSLLKLVYWCYASGIFYASWLKSFYTFTREML